MYVRPPSQNLEVKLRRKNLKVAISTDGSMVSAHFGRCPEFTIADIEDNKVVNKQVVPNPGHQPGYIPQFLHENGVNCIIAGGMGPRAQMFFDQYSIQPIVGVSGRVDDVLEKIIKGTLEGGESLCSPGAGKGYGVDKSQCDHPEDKDC